MHQLVDVAEVEADLLGPSVRVTSCFKCSLGKCLTMNVNLVLWNVACIVLSQIHTFSLKRQLNLGLIFSTWLNYLVLRFVLL